MSSLWNLPSWFSLRYSLFIFFLVLALAPFFLLSFYDHPSADDYCYANKALKTGFLENQIDIYRTWTGRYLENALLDSLNPLVYKTSLGYQLIPVFLLLSLFATFLILVKVLLGGLLSFLQQLATALAGLVLYLANLPSLAEGIYWMSGTYNYQIPAVLFLLFTALLLRFALGDTLGKKPRNLITLVLFLLVFLIAGGNETTLTLLLFCVGTATVLMFRRGKGESRGLLLLLTLAALLGAIYSLMSPGNWARASLFPSKQQPLLTLLLTLYQVTKYLIIWVGDFSLIAASLLFFFSLGRVFRKEHRPAIPLPIDPKIYYLIFITAVILAFSISPWLTGTLMPGRAVNFIYLFFLVGWFFGLFLMVGYFVKRNSVLFRRISGSAFVFLFTVFVISVFWPSKNIYTAYSDLLTRASGYDQSLLARYKKLEDCRGNEESCVVEELSLKPGSVFFDDITADENDWRNRCYAEYYGIRSVKIGDAPIIR